MCIETVNPINYPEWDELLLKNPDYSFFHSSTWARVLCKSYRYTPCYFIVKKDYDLSILIPFMEVNSLLTGKRGVSLPFTDLCKPILTEEDNKDKIIECIIEYGNKRGWKYFEIRDGYNLFNNELPASFYYEHCLTFNKDEQINHSQLKSNVKRNVKKALKEGVAVGFHNDLEAIREFYRLNCITRKYHNLPPQPYKFFKNVFDEIIIKGRGIVVLANYREVIIAGAVYFHFGDKAIYKYGASDRKYQSLRANNLVMWEAIKWYSQKGYKYLSFGRTNPENKGLMQFKSGWGGDVNKIYYYKYNLQNRHFVTDNNTFTLGKKIFRYMPISLSKMIGRLSYRHIG